MFLFGFFISPAIKVTLFQASLLKILPTIALAIAPNAAPFNKGSKLMTPLVLERCCIVHASRQLACHTSHLKAMNPAMINPNSDNNLVEVKMVCINLPVLIPLVLMKVNSTIKRMATSCA